jgi:hypothetical protein
MLTSGYHAQPLAPVDVLSVVFPMPGIAAHENSVKGRPVYVIPQNGEPRWIIVGEPHKALSVLRSWSPWNPGSRFRWNAVKLVAGLRLLPLLPGVESDVAQVGASYWQANMQNFPNRWTAVVHVGSASHTRKAILFLIGEDAAIRFAAKAPLVSGAAEAIIHEARILEQLQQFGYLPKVLFKDCERGVIAQSWLDGKPVSRGFTNAHLELLNNLACENRVARVSEVRAEIVAALNDADFPFDRSVLARGLELLDHDKPLHGFVEHRDFAPWNMKWLSSGGLGLLDWEWSVTESLPWQDACRFFYLDDFHFKGPGNVWERITTEPMLARYARKFEIPGDALAPLTMRYLLRVLPTDWIGGNQDRARHTFRQIQYLLAPRRRFAQVGFESGRAHPMGARKTQA